MGLNAILFVRGLERERTLFLLWTRHLLSMLDGLCWHYRLFCVCEIEVPFHAFLLDYCLAHGFQFPQEMWPTFMFDVNVVFLRRFVSGAVLSGGLTCLVHLRQKVIN